MSLCQDYLSARGITDDVARIYGLELDDRVISKKVKDRLGLGLPKAFNEVLWFPLFDAAGKTISWIARPLPTIAGQPKFRCPVGSGGLPFIPCNVYGLCYGKPVIVTEGPVKSIVCTASGIDTVGINGVWGASIKNVNGLAVIRAGNLGDHVHNPILFQKIARMRDTQDDEYIAKVRLPTGKETSVVGLQASLEVDRHSRTDQPGRVGFPPRADLLSDFA